MRFNNAAYATLVISLCAVIVISSAITFINIFGPEDNWWPFLPFDEPPTEIVAAAAGFQLAPAVSLAGDDEHDISDQHHIPWLFSVYAEPDWQATRIASFNPQPVTILENDGHGWARIGTAYGDAWVYINDNMRYIDRVTGIFFQHPDAPDGSPYPIDVINPQLVRVLEQDGEWLQVETWLGPMWIDLNFRPPVTVLDEFMAQFSGSISVHFENLETGFTYAHNADRVFFGASAIKAPYVLWVYLLAEAGYTDLSTVHTYTSADHWGGSGVIQRMPFGTTFTESELLGHALSVSDNIAFRMLVRRLHGVNGFRDWVAEVGANPDLVHTVTYSHMTAHDTGIFAREMHRYIESGGTYSEQFRQQLLDNRYPFIVSDHPVASKSGWAVGGFHDIAIIYSPSPYALVIMSARDGNAADFRAYRDISMMFQNFNDRYFAGIREE